MCYARSSIRSTIDRYKKVCSNNSNSGTVTEINAQKQYYQQESAKLRQQIQMLQNSNRRLSWKMKACVSDQRYICKSVLYSRNGEVSASKLGDWARAECNPCMSFSEFLRPCYHRGWWHCLLSPGQEILHLG
ncbi:hypothetical protein CUMW_213160 [Citrus unshiu]|uniref:Uncharacterized protein n=1 Tax=Citrus unshiu TaxID=55188 RepID=A0A2H5QB19_CITUN|nr:hypothetical protein CUMW_213160 [Citrus unshiu]